MQTKEKEYHYNIDFLRILFVLFVVYYHFIRAKYVLDYDIDIFNNLAKNARYIGEVCNSALFIISGYFLSRSLIKNISLFNFAFHRLMRFWPVLFFGVSCMWLLSLFKLVSFKTGANNLNLLCITKVGGGLATQFNNLTPTWFVCALFWCSIFYYVLYKAVKNNYIFNFIVIMPMKLYVFKNSSLIRNHCTKRILVVINADLAYFIYFTFHNNHSLINIIADGESTVATEVPFLQIL